MLIRCMTLFSVFFILILCVDHVQDQTITDYFGNVAYDNGTIIFASPPAGKKYLTTNTYDDGGLAVLFAFARSYVNTIQPNPYPYDLIKRVLNGEFDMTSQYMELINYAMGFGICFVIGLLYVIFIPLCGCCFCCCRCCGNCGGDMKQTYDENEDCKRMGFAQALFLMSLCMFASAVCVYITNDRFTVALNYADDSVANNLDDIHAYIQNTESQFRYVATTMYDIVSGALIRDVGAIGPILMAEIFAVLDIDPVINSVISLDNKLQTIDTALDQAIADIGSLQSAANTLSNDINTLKSDIDSTKTSCSGDCTPSTACDSFDTSSLTMNADFSTLPDLTSTQSAIKSVLSDNLTALALDAKAGLEGMSAIINDSTTSIQSSLSSTMDTFKTEINSMMDTFLAQINGAFDTQQLKTELGNFIKTAIDYDVYRQYFGYGLMGLFSFIPLMLFAGILCGCCCLGQNVKPTERGCCPSCGGCLMILATAIMFLLGSLLMLLTTVTFMIGGNFEKICQTLQDLTIFKDFIDIGGIPGFSMGAILLNNASADISLYNLLLGCRDNMAPFDLLKLDTLIPLDDYLNFTKYMGDVDTQIDQISTSVDLSSFTVLTSTMDTSLNDFKSSGIDSIDFAAINSTLATSIVTFDINAMILAMGSIRDQCTGTSRNNWIQHITDAENIRDVSLPAVEAARNQLQTSSSTLEQSISGVTASIDDVLNKARDADDQIQNNVTAVLSSSAQGFKNQIMGYIDSYTAEVRDLVYNDLAACLPLWNLYDSFTVTFCSYTIDALNGFWFGLGWALMFFVPVIIVAVKLSKYYRKMKECKGYGDDSDEEDDEYDDEDDYW